MVQLAVRGSSETCGDDDRGVLPHVGPFDVVGAPLLRVLRLHPGPDEAGDHPFTAVDGDGVPVPLGDAEEGRVAFLEKRPQDYSKFPWHF